MTRIAIMADSAASAQRLRAVLRWAPQLKVVGYVTGGHALREPIEASRTDLILIDHLEAAERALTWVQLARAASRAVKIVVIVKAVDSAHAAEAMRLGADAVIDRAVWGPTLATLVREVGARHIHCAPAARAPMRSVPCNLTARELEVLRFVAAGIANAEIARRLYVTEQTVKFHLSNVYRKLGVANRTAAAHFAYAHGLFSATTPQIAPVMEAA